MPKTPVDARRKAILAKLEARGKVAVADLATDFQVSDVTIRKDLQELEGLSLLRRVHGGAVRMHRSKWNLPIEVREASHASAKEALAASAVSYVKNGDSVILDAGTTTLALARKLSETATNLTVITNSLPVIAELSSAPGIELISLGGSVRRHSLAMIGPLTVAALERLHADVVFLGATGADIERGLCTPNLVEAETKAAMARCATKRVALVDRSKIGAANLAPFCSWQHLNALVTDAPLPAEFKQRLVSAGVETVVTGASGRGSAAREEAFEPEDVGERQQRESILGG